MLHLLLLDAAPATQGMPVSVYVTFVAAVLAALASLNATRVSSKTTREVAAKSAETARESARIAAETAREIKATDYKHDFYKRIIAKRFSAWEEAEKFIVSISETLIDENDNERFYSFFRSASKISDVLDRMRSMMLNQTQWMGKEYGLIFTQLHNFCVEIFREAMRVEGEENRITTLNERHLMLLGKANHEQVNTLINNLLSVLSALVVTIHDVEPFLEELKSSAVRTKF